MSSVPPSTERMKPPRRRGHGRPTAADRTFDDAERERIEGPAVLRRSSATPPRKRKAAKKATKNVARPRVDASDVLLDDLGPIASLLDDYEGSAEQPMWRVHDKTHIEFAVDYPVPKGDKEDYLWEAYFFVPRSLKVNSRTYAKGDIYRDLQSYVRMTLPPLPLGDLTAIPEKTIKPLLRDKERQKEALYELRLFAAQLRRSAHVARRALRRNIHDGEDESVADASQAIVAHFRDILGALRGILQHAVGDDAKTTATWIDEDCSRVAESCLANTSIELRRGGFDDLAALVAAGAVAEASYRKEQGFSGVGSGRANKRDVEHLEYRRHFLKRFTSSVLWLHREVSEAGKWTLQALYVIAASIAMAFAVVAAAYHGTPDANTFGNLWTWATIVVLAYAGKDRIKATLQGVFTRWVKRWMPDRRWRLEDRHRKARIGRVHERTAFYDFKDLPEAVRKVRTTTHQHRLEQQARPEHVLWHQKRCLLHGEAIRDLDKRYQAVTEIFRLDLREWLVHTDDPKQRTVFADPEDQHIYTAMAPRVYNIAVVYRLRKVGEEDVPWRRVRVVISRKGIKRVEHVV